MNRIYGTEYTQTDFDLTQSHPLRPMEAGRKRGAKKAYTALRLCRIHPSGEPPEGFFCVSVSCPSFLRDRTSRYMRIFLPIRRCITELKKKENNRRI